MQEWYQRSACPAAFQRVTDFEIFVSVFENGARGSHLRRVEASTAFFFGRQDPVLEVLELLLVLLCMSSNLPMHIASLGMVVPHDVSFLRRGARWLDQ